LQAGQPDALLGRMIRTFRLIAFAEGVSYLVLLGIAMPLKYLAGMPLAVRITGSIHGLLFILFCVQLYRVAIEHEWPPRRWLFAFAMSLIPFGTFVLDRRLRVNAG
jgi:integral membrane protein